MLKKIFFIVLIVLGIVAYYYIDFTPINRVPGSKVIIIGATSGIGKAMAQEFIKRGYFVGITGRRQGLLAQLQQELGPRCYSRFMDSTVIEQAQTTLQELITSMGGMDICVVNAGVATSKLDWESQKRVIDTNVTGFAAVVTSAMNYFMQKGSGHIVGISSFTALRGIGNIPTYSASKAFESHYLDALRARFATMNLPIYVTDIQPGLINTAMAQDPTVAKPEFTARLGSSPHDAAAEICDAIERRYAHAYVTKGWFLVAWAFKLLPECIFNKLV